MCPDRAGDEGPADLRAGGPAALAFLGKGIDALQLLQQRCIHFSNRQQMENTHQLPTAAFFQP